MDLAILEQFFLWCSVINIVLLAVSGIMVWLLNDFICLMHGKFMKMPPEDIRRSLYLIFGFYKIAIFIFCIVPYIALLIINS